MPTASENYTKSNPSNNNNNNNVSASCSRNSRSSKKKGPAPFLFFSNMLKKKKILEIDDIMFDREMSQRARSEPSGIYNFFFGNIILKGTVADGVRNNRVGR
jgi:hypothetical protein